MLLQNIPYSLREQFIIGSQNIKKDVSYLQKAHPKTFSWIENVDEIVDILALGLFYRTIIAPLYSGSNFCDNLKSYENVELSNQRVVLIGTKEFTLKDSQQLKTMHFEFMNIMLSYGLDKTFLNTSDIKTALKLIRA